MCLPRPVCAGPCWRERGLLPQLRCVGWDGGGLAPPHPTRSCCPLRVVRGHFPLHPSAGNGLTT